MSYSGRYFCYQITHEFESLTYTNTNSIDANRIPSTNVNAEESRKINHFFFLQNSKNAQLILVEFMSTEVMIFRFDSIGAVIWLLIMHRLFACVCLFVG